MIKQSLMGLESWSLQMDPRTPRPVMERVDPRVSGGGQIVITSEHHLNPDDGLLSLARFAGVLLEQQGDFGIAGNGMGWYMGDENGVGTYFAFPVTVGPPGNFSAWAAALTPEGLTTGYVTPGLTGHPFTYERMSLKDVLADVMKRFGTEWRIHPTGVVDFGYRSTLFRIANPSALVLPNSDHSDLDRSTLPGRLQVDRDIKDYVRGLRFLSSDGATLLETANGDVADVDVPYRNFAGGVVKRDKAVRASGDVTGFETALADAEFEKTRYPRQEFSLSTDHYTISGDFECGDMLRIYDRQRGIQDLENPMVSGGVVIYPETVRCVGLSWPVTDDYGVYLRRFIKNGSTWEVQWVDLTEYVMFESGPTTIDVGARARPITRP